jgi:hypothetical protein
MSPFWISFFEDVKDCGRNATLFVVTLGALLLGLLVVVALCESELGKYIIPALPLAGGMAVFWVSVAFPPARARRRERLNYSPLSDDDLRVARLKLTKNRLRSR